MPHAETQTSVKVRKDGRPYGNPDRSVKPPRPTQRLITGSQASLLFGIPYRSLYDLYVNGDLPAIRFNENGRLFFEREAIEQLIENSRVIHEKAHA